MNARMNLRPTLFASIAIASSLMLSACATAPSSGYASAPSPAYGDHCPDCGTVTRIDEGAGSRTPNATGAVVGAVIGGLAGKGAAEAVNPTVDEALWREAYVGDSPLAGLRARAHEEHADRLGQGVALAVMAPQQPGLG